MALTKEKTEEIIKKIEEAIKKKSGQSGFKCPVCTNNQFSLAGGFTNDFLMDKLGGGLVIGGPVLPSIPIVCTNCGNTFFLNTMVLGIDIDKEVISKENKEKDKPRKEEKKNG
ncbi:MAG: hypothetical protein IIA87_04960 [Nanoarchaeota archaeon]|nr:hypothetical protein [Nanoarchaeota archaeon]